MSELERLLSLSPIALNICWNVFSGILIFNPSISAFFLSSSCIIAVSASWTCFLPTAASLSIYCLIQVSFPSLLKRCVCQLFHTKSFILEGRLCHAPNAWTLPTSKVLLPSFAWWRDPVDHLVDLPYLLARCGKRFTFGALTLEVCIDFVVGRDVGWCKMWITWKEAASLYQGWYVWSTWTKKTLHCNSHWIGSSKVNCITWLNGEHVFHVRTQGCLETTITRCPFHWRVSFL